VHVEQTHKIHTFNTWRNSCHEISDDAPTAAKPFPVRYHVIIDRREERSHHRATFFDGNVLFGRARGEQRQLNLLYLRSGRGVVRYPTADNLFRRICNSSARRLVDERTTYKSNGRRPSIGARVHARINRQHCRVVEWRNGDRTRFAKTSIVGRMGAHRQRPSTSCVGGEVSDYTTRKREPAAFRRRPLNRPHDDDGGGGGGGGGGDDDDDGLCQQSQRTLRMQRQATADAAALARQSVSPPRSEVRQTTTPSGRWCASAAERKTRSRRRRLRDLRTSTLYSRRRNTSKVRQREPVVDESTAIAAALRSIRETTASVGCELTIVNPTQYTTSTESVGLYI